MEPEVTIPEPEVTLNSRQRQYLLITATPDMSRRSTQPETFWHPAPLMNEYGKPEVTNLDRK